MTIGRGPQIANAVVALLVDPARPWNAGGAIAAERQYLKVYKPDVLKTLKTTVTATQLDTGDNPNIGKKTRQALEETYTVTLSLLKRVSFVDELPVLDEIDALDYTAERIYDYFNNTGAAGSVHFTAAGVQWAVLKASRDLLNVLYEQHQWETEINLLVWGVVA